MKKVILFILLVFFTKCLTMNATMAWENRPARGEIIGVCLQRSIAGQDNGTVLFVAAGGVNDWGEDTQAPAPEIPEEEESDALEYTVESNESKESKAGKLIMSLLLTTLVVICLSVMPLVMISRASKTRRKQSQQGKK